MLVLVVVVSVTCIAISVLLAFLLLSVALFVDTLTLTGGVGKIMAPNVYGALRGEWRTFVVLVSKKKKTLFFFLRN